MTNALKQAAKYADQLYTTREERYALQRKADALKKQEQETETKLREALAEAKAVSVGGKVCRVDLVTKTVPVVEDWGKVYAHIQRTKGYDLLQKRLNAEAVKLRWEDKKAIPGVGREDVVTLSIHKQTEG